MGDEGTAVLRIGLLESGDGTLGPIDRRKHVLFVVPTVERVVGLLPRLLKKTNVSAKLHTSCGNAAIARLSSHAFLALPCSRARYV